MVKVFMIFLFGREAKIKEFGIHYFTTRSGQLVLGVKQISDLKGKMIFTHANNIDI